MGNEHLADPGFPAVTVDIEEEKGIADYVPKLQPYLQREKRWVCGANEKDALGTWEALSPEPDGPRRL